MKITLSPQRGTAPVTVTRTGDALTIDGETFDFSPLPEGGELPVEAIGSDHFHGPARREGGVIHLVLRLPHGPDAPPETRFPQPVTPEGDGPVPLPPFDAPQEETA